MITNSIAAELVNEIHVSMVLPSFNCNRVLKDNLPVVIGALSASALPFEIIIVDDGSHEPVSDRETDGHHAVKIIRHKQNMGKGAALKSGMLAAKGKFVFFTDADVPFETSILGKMLHYLSLMDYDMVVGDRTLPGSKYFSEIKTTRKWGSRFFNRLVGNFVAGGWYDTQCGIKAFRRNVAHDLYGMALIKGFAIDVEIIYLALKRNYDIKRVPVVMRNDAGDSVRLFRHGLPMLMDVFRVIFFYYSGRYPHLVHQVEK